MEIEKLGIWGRNPPAAWVRGAADRWAALLMRGAFLYLSVYDASPFPRTETEILFLLLLSEGEKSEPAVLAERLRVSRQTMTGLLDKLEAAGCVTRTDHPTDRRRKVVRLAPAGLDLARELFAAILRRDAALIATFDREKTVETLDTMEDI